MSSPATAEVAELLGTSEGSVAWQGTALKRPIMANLKGHTTNEPIFGEEGQDKQIAFLREGWRYYDMELDGAMGIEPVWDSARPMFGALYR